MTKIARCVKPYINYMAQIRMLPLMMGMLIMGIARGKVSDDRIVEVLAQRLLL